MGKEIDRRFYELVFEECQCGTPNQNLSPILWYLEYPQRFGNGLFPLAQQ